MRINNNISALNAWRYLSATDSLMSKSLERLSSGLRINRAADDAAGLAISEKMRGQIRGLNQAIRNAQDAISLIQTAEGALSGTHSILLRMRELANQAASDTQTAEDRAKIQDEINALMEELNRIGNTTEFNTQKLLDGTFLNRTFQIGANAGQTIKVKIDDMRATNLGARWGDGASIVQTDLASLSDVSINGVSISLTGVTDVAGVITKINEKTYLTGVKAERLTTTSSGNLTFTARASATTVTINGVSISVDNRDTASTFVGKVNAVSSQTGVTATINGSNVVLTHGSGGDIAVTDSGNVIGGSKTWLAGIRLVSGIGQDIVVSGTNAAKLGLNGLPDQDKKVSSLNVGTAASASEALTIVDYAVSKVSEQRSALGALQNRLEHTIANLSTAAENLTAAESRIRDADMAAEMAAFTRHQILLQAGMAMMAQANTKLQAVLQLLR